MASQTLLNGKNILSPYCVRTEGLIRKDLEGWKEETPLYEACRFALLNGGKRFRPALVLMIADLLGKGDASQGALAIEYLHTSSLIADDLPCMDNESERRGVQTTHLKYGEDVALLVTYTLIAAGYQCLARGCAQLPFGKEICSDVVQLVSQRAGILGAAGGQYLDLHPPKLSESTAREVIYKKTASLFEIAFGLGWLMGGGEKDLIATALRAGYHFGMAFQIADDCGDSTQDIKNERDINVVNILGSKEASKMFHVELQACREKLEAIGLSSSPVAELLEGLSHLE